MLRAGRPKSLLFLLVSRRSLLICFCLSFFCAARAQNLLANSGFEDLNFCAELHQYCSPEAWFYIKPAAPPVVQFVPQPNSGKESLIVPIENVYNKGKKRTFVYTMLCCPLIKAKEYRLSFYLNTAGNKFYGLDFFMRAQDFRSDNFLPESAAPSVRISGEQLPSKFSGWFKVDTIYTARGDERFFLIGNLNATPFRFPPGERMNKAGDIFYFIDQISFTPLDSSETCGQFSRNVDIMYAQNLRHTERALMEPAPELVTDTITVPAVFFETDKAVLKPAFRKLIDSLCLQLASKNVTSLKILGHTDNAGTAEHNLRLSSQRAESVLQYFKSKMPAPLTAFAEGKGETIPVADNKTKKGMAANRRVELIITYSKQNPNP